MDIATADRAEMLRDLKNFLIKDRPEHQSIDELKERDWVNEANSRCSTIRGQTFYLTQSQYTDTALTL